MPAVERVTHFSLRDPLGTDQEKIAAYRLNLSFFASQCFGQRIGQGIVHADVAELPARPLQRLPVEGCSASP